MTPGEVQVVTGDYYKTGDQQVKIGGTEQVAVTATTDYTANTNADGVSGTDKTANLSVTAVASASTVTFTVTNNDAGQIYRGKLQIRGKGLYDDAPVTVEAQSKQPYAAQVV